MPIKIPEDLPAYKVLSDENIFVMNVERAVTQDIRPLKIAILNLMPKKIQTENQLLRYLSNTPIQVEIKLLKTKSYKSSHTSEEHMEKFYAPSNMVLSVAGNFNEEELLTCAEKYFGNMKDSYCTFPEAVKPTFAKGENTTVKEIEQANLAIGYECFGYDDDRRYPLIILNNAFGSSMSSRLFQRIREDEGLAYSVYTSLGSYKDIGLFSIYAGLKAENLKKTEKIIKEETERLLKSGLTEEEILRAKKQIAGSLILSGESVSSHMSSIGKGILLNGKVKSEEEILKKVEEATPEDILTVAELVFSGEKYFKEIVKGK